MQKYKKNAATQVAEIDYHKIDRISITYSPSVNPADRAQISSSEHAADIFRLYWGADIFMRERVFALFLNQSNRVLGIHEISAGGIAGATVDIKLLFQSALAANATAIIIAHNHPSGNLKPSREDINLTFSIKEAGRVLDIKVLDHIVLGYDDYYSFADNDRVL